MSVYTKIFGSLLILLSAYITGRGYSLYAEKRISECEGFLSFLIHIKGQITRTLTPPLDFFKDFKCEPLMRSGFLTELEAGKTLTEAFDTSKQRLSIGKQAKELLWDFFYGFGGDYKDGELARLGEFEQRLSETVKKDREELPKSVKLVRTLLISGALGLIILFL